MPFHKTYNIKSGISTKVASIVQCIQYVIQWWDKGRQNAPA